jgi:xanthine/uracil permease
MALFVALTVVKSENSAGTIQIAIPTNGNGGIVFESIPSTVVGGITAVSKITIPASGLNQKAKEYYSASTVAALVLLMV